MYDCQSILDYFLMIITLYTVLYFNYMISYSINYFKRKYWRKYWTYNRRCIELLLEQFFYKYNTIIKSKLIDHVQNDNCRIYCYIISHIKQSNPNNQTPAASYSKRKRKKIHLKKWYVSNKSSKDNSHVIQE